MGFGQGYTMQSYDNDHDGIPQFEDWSKEQKSGDLNDHHYESGPKILNKNETLNVPVNSKETRARRKSSTLDMFNDPADFMQQVEQHLENVPEDHSVDTKSDSTPGSKKENLPRNSLKARMQEKKKTAPYKPANYQPAHFSPSPRRYPPPQKLNVEPTEDEDLFAPPFISSNEHQNYIEPETHLDLKLTKSQSHNPGPYQPIFQRSYSHNLGYNDPGRLQGYGHHGEDLTNMMHMGMANIPENYNNIHNQYYQQPMVYGHYERECYSPDVARHNFIEVPEYRRLSTNEYAYPPNAWGQYQAAPLQPAGYWQQPVTPKPGVPEVKLNFKSDSSHSGSLEKKNSSQGDDSEHKSSKDFEEGGASYDMPSSKVIENASQLAKDQSGCRMLQKMIEEGDQNTIEEIYKKILPHFVELMNNPFGNYLCQKITDACGKDQLKAIIEVIEKDVVDICRNSHGTRAIQKIVECSKDKELIQQIIDLLKDHVRTLVEDINGNHAIQKILFTFKAPNNEFIFETMIEQCKEIACHKHGCCVMQKCIDGANKDQKKRLIDQIISHTKHFVRNPYGNYVLQYVLELKDLDINASIGKQLLGSLIELVTYEKSRKFSSNVIEKCLQINHKDVKNAMVKEMLDADSYLPFLEDQYGNYVVQKTLSVAEKDDLEKLLQKIKPDMEKLKRSSEFGQKIYSKLVKTYPSLQPKTQPKKKNNKKNKSNQKPQTKPKNSQDKDRRILNGPVSFI